jgi:hypothetical protein
MSARGTAHRRRARRAGRGAWLAVLLVPTAVLSVVLKVVRLAQVPATGPWWTRPADLVSDLTFSAAWIVGWWVLAVAGSRRLTRALVLAAAQLSTWAWSVLLVVYHEYWMRTGNTLTLDRLMATWRGGTTCRGCSAPSSRRGRWPCWPGDPRVHGVADGAGRARSRRAGSVVGPSRPGADHPAARLPTGRSLGADVPGRGRPRGGAGPGPTTTNAQAADLPSTATLAGGRFASVRGPHGALDVRCAISGRCGGQRKRTVCRQRLSLVRLSPRTGGRRAGRRWPVVTR